MLLAAVLIFHLGAAPEVRTLQHINKMKHRAEQCTIGAKAVEQYLDSNVRMHLVARRSEGFKLVQDFGAKLVRS